MIFSGNTSVIKNVVKGIHKNMPNSYPNVPFFENYKIGDFGYFDEYVFDKKGNISDLGVKFKKEKEDFARPFNFSSENINQVFSGLDASLSPAINAKASLKLNFSGTNSYSCKGALVSKEYINDPHRNVEDQLRILMKQNKWNKKHVVITTAFYSRNTFLVGSINSEGNAGIDILCKSPDILTEANIFQPDIRVSYNTLSGRNVGLEVYTTDHDKDSLVFIQMGKLNRRELTTYNRTPYRVLRELSEMDITSEMDILSDMSTIPDSKYEYKEYNSDYYFELI